MHGNYSSNVGVRYGPGRKYGGPSVNSTNRGSQSGRNSAEQHWIDSWKGISELALRYPNTFKLEGGDLKTSLPKAELGGYLNGASHKNGGIPLEAEGGEYIIRKNVVDNLGVPFFDMLNSMSMNHKSGSDYLESFSQLSEKVNNIDKQMTNSFVMDDYWNETNQVGISEVNSSDGELKALIRELIHAIKEGDMTIAEAIDDIEMNLI